jgi:hypothetical protein
LAWLTKGVRETERDPSIFSADDAIVRLGVGKNMVRSIRHWCQTLRLIEETAGYRGRYHATALGQMVFGEDGVDPFLEHTGTVWWLHWQLATNRERATTWFYTFNDWPRQDFSKAALKTGLSQWVELQGGAVPSVASMDRDIDCMVRTYSTPRGRLREEAIECPLTELGLIREVDERWWLARGPKPSLPDHVFLAALVDYYGRIDHPGSTISAETLLYGINSPVRVFLLDENSAVERLYRLADLTSGALLYDVTAGLRQVIVRGSLPDQYYWLRQSYVEGVGHALS